MSNSSPRAPGAGVAGDVAHRVPAALARGQPGVAELADQLAASGSGTWCIWMFWRVVTWPLRSGTYFSIDVGERLQLLGRDAAHRQLYADHLDVWLALAVDALLEAELDELVPVELALRGTAWTRCRSRRTRARGSGSRGRERSRPPLGFPANRCERCRSWGVRGKRAPCGSSGRGRRCKSSKRQSEYSYLAAAAGDSARARCARRRLPGFKPRARAARAALATPSDRPACSHALRRGAGQGRGRRGLAHEPFDGGDDRSGLLGRGVGRDDRELRAAVRSRAARGIVRDPMPSFPCSATTRSLAAVSPDATRSTASREALLRHHARRVGDAGEGLPRRARPTATSGRCPRAATTSRWSSGSPRSRQPGRTGCRR